MEVVSITELSDLIHEHRKEIFEIKFSGVICNEVQIKFGASVKPVVASDGSDFDTQRFVFEIYDNPRKKTLSFDLPMGRTSVSIYKCLITYFYHYFRDLPAAFIINSTETKQDGSVSGNAHMPMNLSLLNLIIFIQRSKAYHTSRCEFHKTNHNWYAEVQRDYDDIPAETFHNAGIKKCHHNLEEMLRFEVTDEMLNCATEEMLSKFTAPLYGKENKGGHDQ